MDTSYAAALFIIFANFVRVVVFVWLFLHLVMLVSRPLVRFMRGLPRRKIT